MNFSRKIWHMSGILIPAALYLDLFSGYAGYCHATRIVMASILGVFLFFNVFIDIIRLNHASSGEFIWKYLGFLMKSDEKNRINGIIPYMVSNILVILFVHEEIAIPAIIFLVICDPFAAFSGYLFGKTRIVNGRTLEGTLGFIVTGLTAALLVYMLNGKGYYESGFFPFLIMVTFGVTAAAVTELYSKTMLNGFVDDNLLIPLVSSVVMILVAALGGNAPGNLVISLTELLSC